MENFSIDERSGVPIWVQLRNRLVYLIQTGRYQPGDQLPTVHEMAVNPVSYTHLDVYKRQAPSRSSRKATR